MRYVCIQCATRDIEFTTKTFTFAWVMEYEAIDGAFVNVNLFTSSY